jgi:hypothetical protein
MPVPELKEVSRKINQKKDNPEKLVLKSVQVPRKNVFWV